MNIFTTLIVKISGIIAAIVLFVGLGSAPAHPPVTEINIPGFTARPVVEVTASPTPIATSAGALPDTPTPTSVSLPIPEPTPNVPIIIVQIPTPEPATVTSTPTPMPEVAAAPQPKYVLDIINPFGGKGLGRTYKSRAEVLDEANYLDIGLIVTDSKTGEVSEDAIVAVKATDDSQSKSMNGTGNVTKIYPDGNMRTVHYYPFHYEIKTPGDHTITFTVEGQTKSVTISATADER